MKRLFVKLGPHDAWFLFVMRYDSRIVYEKMCLIWVDVSFVHSSHLVHQFGSKLTHQSKLYVPDWTNLFKHIHTWRTTNTYHASCGPSFRLMCNNCNFFFLSKEVKLIRRCVSDFSLWYTVCPISFELRFPKLILMAPFSQNFWYLFLNHSFTTYQISSRSVHMRHYIVIRCQCMPIARVTLIWNVEQLRATCHNKMLC